MAEVFAQVVVFWTRKFPRTERVKDNAYAILESADNFAGGSEYLSHLLSSIMFHEFHAVPPAVYRKNVTGRSDLHI